MFFGLILPNKQFIFIYKYLDTMIFENKTYEELLDLQDTLEKEYEEIKKDCLKERLEFDKFCEKSKPTKEKLYFISKYIRLKQPPIIVYDKQWNGDFYSLEEFIEKCKNQEINDNNGYGNYATHNSKSDVKILPSDILENIYRKDFTHVIWFKK